MHSPAAAAAVVAVLAACLYGAPAAVTARNPEPLNHRPIIGETNTHIDIQTHRHKQAYIVVWRVVYILFLRV